MKKYLQIWRSVFLLYIVFCLTCLAGCGQSESAQMTIDILKIGKADCSIISDGAHTIVIDCGEADDSAEILDTLSKMQINQIDYLILTHFDKDHIGSAAEIIERCEIGAIIEPDYTPENPESEAYLAYREGLAQTNTSVASVSDRMEINIGEMSISVMGSDERTYTQNIDNNQSLIVAIEHMGNRFLFAGDIEKQRISDLLEEGIDRFDFLKVPHHGVYNKKLPLLFSSVNMDYAVITCSEKNPADQETLDALSETGCRVFCTSDGTVHVTSSGKGIEVVQ